MAYENVVINHEEQYSIITINRPKQMNALNKQTIEELHKALSELNKDGKVRAVIITGSGDKAFVAGADIKEFLGKPIIGYPIEEAINSKIFDEINGRIRFIRLHHHRHRNRRRSGSEWGSA